MRTKQNGSIPCLIMDTNFHSLGYGELRSPPSTHNVRLKVPPGQSQAVVRAEIVHVFPTLDDVPAWTGRVILLRGNDVILEPVGETDTEGSLNLTVPVDFDTFVYPDTGGRLRVQAVDLSCDGLSFSTVEELPLGGLFQVVIPITVEGPLLLSGEILHRRTTGDKVVYTSRFCDLCSDEEHLVRNAVFHVQLDIGRRQDAVVSHVEA